MCRFCDLLKNGEELYWSERSTYAGDNLCKFVSSKDKYEMCEGCNGCGYRGFKLTSYVLDGNTRIGVSYFRKPHGIEVSPFSEPIPFSFCPFCGNQVSKKIEEFNRNDFRYSIISEKE